MLWLVRLVEPVTRPPPFPDPLRAVLDVVVLNTTGDFGLSTGCGPNSVLSDGKTGWRLDLYAGRLRPADPAAAVCYGD